MDEDRYDRQRRIWGKNGQTRLEQAKVLIAGAGGVGSEVIKNLALLGIGKLVLIDMDLIELSNLNRQLLFRKADVGKYKAEIAAKKAAELNSEIEIEFFNQKIQDLPNTVYEGAGFFISALDNIPARIFLNQKAILLNKPLVDGGSEGFYGHVQVVIPQLTPCLLCHDIWSRSEEKFKCSYAVNPRTPLDCALEGRDKFYLQFNRLPNPESEDDIQIVHEHAQSHAEKYGIIGLTYQLVKDSLRGTVAALVTTNAIIGAVMTNELLKIILKGVSIDEIELSPLTYYQFNGVTESGWSVPLERNEKCPVCSIKQVELEVSSAIPLIQFIHHLDTQLPFELKAPLLLKEGIILYRDMSVVDSQSLPSGERARIKENEIKPVKDFFKDGETLFLKDEILGIELWIKVLFVNPDEDGVI